MKLRFLDSKFAICQLDSSAALPGWSVGDFVVSVRTSDELTVVCPQSCVPVDVKSSRDWRCIQFVESMDFGMVGVIARLSQILADVKVSIFVISTYNTDFVLIPNSQTQLASSELVKAGYEFCSDPPPPGE